MKPDLILVNDRDKKTGYGSLAECHLGRGRHHRAFVTLLFDSQGRVLLQRRRHKLFDGLWDLTAISHPLHLNPRDETYQEASSRALLEEMGIYDVAVSKLGGFNYYARDGGNCENEYCAVLVGNYDGVFKPNKSKVYEVRKVKFEDFLSDIAKNPRKYTPWVIKSAKFLKEHNPDLLQSELTSFLAVYEQYATAYFANKVKETAKYSSLVSDFYKKLADFSQGGKKLRAFFVWLGYQIGGGKELSKILPISLAFEMTQNFLLIHDDIMDNSTLRRGKLTIHKAYEKKFGRHYGESMAILLGDIASIEVYEIINGSNFSDELKVSCQRLFAKILLETAYGQGLDIEYSFKKPTFEQIMQIADLKAARYSVIAPLTIGASLAGAGEEQLEVLAKYGASIGLAFQLADDILGVFGEEETLGKSVLSDMREGKNTLLIHKTKQLSGEKQTIDKIWGNNKATAADLNKIKMIIEESGALVWCLDQNRKLAAKAKIQAKKITTDRKLVIILGQVADFVISRQK